MGLLYGVLLCNARAMGEFGAVSVVSGHIRGETNTMPLHVEILYNEYQFVAAFAVASLLALLALVTLVAKTVLEAHGWTKGRCRSEDRSSTDVSKRFGDFAALDNVDLEVATGELVALLGPSGSGKTTLLRIIAGLDWPDARRVSCSTARTRLARTRGERQVGFVFQHYALFRHMTVFENVAFGLRVRPRAHPPERGRDPRDACNELLELVQLDWLADRYPHQLSGGQRQRVALARALAIEPRVLLLDEPFGALDAKVRKELRRWLRRLHDEIHVTSVFVTHDQEEALEVADRVVVMDQGRIEQVGTPDEVYDHPATAFVHDFIGESIVVPVEVRDGQGPARRQGAQSSKPTAPPPGPSKLFIRRHDMQIGPAGSGFEGAVKHVRTFGPIQRAEVALCGGEGNTVIEIDAPRDRELKPGETVGLQPRRYRIFAA